MPTVPYTITIVQIKKNALIIDIQRLPTAPPIEVHPHIGFQIIVEGYWVLKANHLNEIPTQISPQQLLKATPYQRQLDYWRQLLCGQEEQLSLKESHYLDTLTEPELKAVLRQRQVHAYSRQGVSFLLYRNPQPHDFIRLAELFILDTEQINETQYRFQLYREDLLAHLSVGLSWGTGSFVQA